MHYPTDWMLGKPRGSLKELKTYYRITISPPNSKQMTKSFPFNGNKQKAKKDAMKYMEDTSRDLGLTRNMIRYLDKDTIEVDADNDIKFITDAVNLDKVQQYPLNIKTKKEKDEDKLYVMYQDKKLRVQFTSLITNYKIVKYIDGNTLNLRLSNLCEFGSISKDIIKNEECNDQYKYFKIDDYNKLPKNKWILGKPSGSIFVRTDDDKYSANITDDNGKQHTKTFSFKEYGDRKKAKKEAIKWKINTSYMLGFTKNLIRIIDDDTIELKLTKDKILKTDIEFIPLIQEYCICSLYDKDDDRNDYAGVSIGESVIKFHKLITGFDMVDHINGDSLDNRLINLRHTDYTLNNLNKVTYTEDTGVRKIEENGLTYYRTKLKFYGNNITKNFYINKSSPDDVAKERAREFRRMLVLIDESNEDVIIPDKIDVNIIKKFVKVMKKLKDNIDKYTVKDFDKYMPSAKIDTDKKKLMHNKYLNVQNQRLKNLDAKLDKIKVAFTDNLFR